MDVQTISNQVVRDPEYITGYHQPDPIPVGERVIDTVERNGNRIRTRHWHNIDHAVPPPLPIVVTPEPRVVPVTSTVRVPVTTHHQVMVPVPVTEEHTEVEETQNVVYENQQFEETVYDEVEEKVPVVRYEKRTREVPREVMRKETVYDVVEENVPVTTYQTQTRKVPRKVIHEHTVPKTVIERNPVTVKTTSTQQVPATVAVTRW